MKPARFNLIVLSLLTAGFLLIGLFLLLNISILSASADAGTLFVANNGAGTSCAQDHPCALQTGLAQALDGDTIYVEYGGYTGTETSVITLTKSITLAGGWDGTTIIPIVRDPDQYYTILDGERERRVVTISGDITPTLDGFIVTHGNASGLYANCPTEPDGCGGGIAVFNAHPRIMNNIIANNIAAATTGTPDHYIGYGGGLFLNGAERAVISSNEIFSNSASTANIGYGGGLYLYGNSDGLLIQSNLILNNSATTKSSPGCGGGIAGGPDGVLIWGNTFQGNRASSGSGGSGAAVYQSTGSATYLHNLITGNGITSAVYLEHSGAHFEGNRLEDNSSWVGIQLVNGPVGGGGPTFINNVIIRSGYGFSIRGWKTLPLTVKLLHNTLVGSTKGYGVYGDFYVTLSMTNTIVTNFKWGITNTYPSSSTVLVDHTLFWVNKQDGIRGTHPVDGNPAFISDGYHLGSLSAALDTGVNAGVFTDIDGDHRPIGAGFDIGADEGEIMITIFLPVVLK